MEMQLKKKFMNIEECSAYTGYKVSTLYKKVHYRTIPFSKPPGSRRVIFWIDRIDKWIKDGHVEPVQQDEMQKAG